MPHNEIKNHLSMWCNYPKEKLFCQVSTCSEGKPHIRTMDLYRIDDEGNLILLTDTSTLKWRDLSACNHVSICILIPEKGQIIVEGLADCFTYSKNKELVHHYWNYLELYWRDFYLNRSKTIQHSIPESFGVIIVKPNFWELLELDSIDYLKSKRKQFSSKNGSWELYLTHPL